MQRFILPAMILALFASVWGCNSQSPLAHDNTTETRSTKLEREVKSLQDANMQTAALLRLERSKTAQLEKERDDLASQVKTRADERDAVYAQFDRFRKDLRDLVGQVDQSMGELRASERLPISVLPMPRVAD